MRLVLATRNPGKIRELRRLLADLPGFELVTLADLHAAPDVVEDGESFDANARKKALVIAHATGAMALADDSGLEVDALGGRPGIHSARYAGEDATDAANNAKLVADLAGVPEPKRTARYRAVLAFADPAGPLAADVHVEEGRCEGHLRLEPTGTGGFGYDPYFVPTGFDLTMAELSPDVKNGVSHRGQAARAMRAFLADYLARRTGPRAPR